MLTRISSQELTEWMAYELIEPFPSERMDADIAMLAALTANINTDQKKRSKPFEIVDFLLFKEKVDEGVDVKAARFAAMFGVDE